MKKSFLTLFILLLVISFFPLACHKTNDIVIPPKEEVKEPEDGGISLQPKEGWGCVTCKNEDTTSTLKNIVGKIVAVVRLANNSGEKEISYAIDIATLDFDIVGGWRLDESNNDSLLVPCPSLPTKWQKPEIRVQVSGQVKNCKGLIADPIVRHIYGRKFEITSIK